MSAGFRIAGEIEVPRSELEVRTSRSSGAGGQHVNKTSSRVEIVWNIAASRALSEEQKRVILTRLGSRVREDGSVRVVSSETRSQHRNRERAELRLGQLIAHALAEKKKRKPTRPPRAANEARLTEKKRHSEKKRERRPSLPE